MIIDMKKACAVPMPTVPQSGNPHGNPVPMPTVPQQGDPHGSAVPMPKVGGSPCDVTSLSREANSERERGPGGSSGPGNGFGGGIEPDFLRNLEKTFLD